MLDWNQIVLGWARQQFVLPEFATEVLKTAQSCGQWTLACDFVLHN